MANELSVSISMILNKDNNYHRSSPSQFQADITDGKGPSPGAVTVSTSGTDIDLTQLGETPGPCWLRNIDDDNFVTYGIRDLDTGNFYPLGELGPGEINYIRLSREFGEEYRGTVTGTGSGGTGNVFHFRADTAPVVVIVNGFAN